MGTPGSQAAPWFRFLYDDLYEYEDWSHVMELTTFARRLMDQLVFKGLHELLDELVIVLGN